MIFQSVYKKKRYIIIIRSSGVTGVKVSPSKNTIILIII